MNRPSRPGLLGAAVLALALAACRGDDPADPTPQPPAPTGPISAPAEEWTWVEFPSARCMNGSATGIGVNLTQRSTQVLIFLEGGGACFNATSCLALVDNAGGYGPAEFQQDVLSGGGARGVFDRDDPDNPFRDWSYVYVPYCTGDVHAGSATQSPTGRMHLGYRNIGIYLERLLPTLQGTTRVVLAGSSAGGFGATFNYDRVQKAFGDVPVLLLNDSGPVFSPAYLKPCLEEVWRTAWNLDASLPEGCEACRAESGGLLAVLPHLARTYPDRRFGLVTTTEDRIIRTFLSFGYSPTCDQLANTDMPAEDFRAGVDELRDTVLAPYPNFRMYTPAGSKHTFLHDAPLGATRVGGVTLTDWVRGLVGASAVPWENVQ